MQPQDIMRRLETLEKNLKRQGKPHAEVRMEVHKEKKRILDEEKRKEDAAAKIIKKESDLLIKDLEDAERLRIASHMTMDVHSRITWRRRWTLVSYYTVGTGYEAEARRLMESCKNFQINYYIEGVRNLLSWQRNTHYKARFIRRVIEHIDGPIVFVDADGMVKEYPLLFDFVNDDLAAYFKSSGYDLLSGTLFFNNTKSARKLLDAWISENSRNISTWDQKNLSNILPYWDGQDNFSIYRLPASYCLIYDLMKGKGPPIIEHFQASRRFRDEVEREGNMRIEPLRGRIAILVPTKNRSQNVERFLTSAFLKAGNPHRVKVYLLVHKCMENQLPDTPKVVSRLGLQDNIVVVEEDPIPENEPVNLSRFWNVLYDHARNWADYFGFFGDDAEFRTPEWDTKVDLAFRDHADQPWLVRVNDCHQDDKAVLFFTSRRLHEIAGFYMPEQYFNVCMDEFWSEVTRAADCQTYLDGVIAYHHACILGRAPMDKTHQDARTHKEKDLALYGTGEETEKRHTLIKKLQADLKEEKLPVVSPGTVNDAEYRIIIPYYEGGAKTSRAANTWVSDRTTFIVTSKSASPPGRGVVEVIYTPHNAKTAGISETDKPYLIDMLKRVREAHPEAHYYIYCNGDSMLPPGLNPMWLLPQKQSVAAVHHRLEMVRGNGDEKIRDLKSSGHYQVGKDLFALRADVVDEIIRSFRDVIIGACGWDDGLACWLWMKYGQNSVDLRYGEIMHQLHKIEWSPKAEDAAFNSRQLSASGVHNYSRVKGDWKDIYSRIRDTIKAYPKPKVLGIFQPARAGDIIIVLPIAKNYYDLGYRVMWPVADQYVDIFDYYAPWVAAIPMDGTNYGMMYKSSKKLVDDFAAKEGHEVAGYLDLAIGFGGGSEEWKDEPFDVYKYRVAGLSIEDKYGLRIGRNYKREAWLRKKLGLEREKSYAVTHSKSSFASHDFGIKDAVEVRPVEGFCLCDWIGIISEASELRCVDSCVANLANQLGLCAGRRHFRPWHEKYNERQMMRLTPHLADGWGIIGK